MPSAEKLSSEALKLESASTNEQKPSENAQKDIEQNNGEKSISPIQQVLQIINNKTRNLEKRKNKLDGYIKEEEDGKELSSEQKKAVQKYEEVVSQLAISKEFCKQFQTIASAASKEAKREARKATFLRQMQETAKVREVLIIQDLLRQLKNDAIRNDFLNAQNGACLVEADEMNVLEQFAKHTIPIHPSFSNEPSFSSSAKISADHFSFVVDGRNRQFMETGFTYEKIKELFQRIKSCGYFEKDIEIVEEMERPTESETPQTDCDLDSGKEEKVESVSVAMMSTTSLPPNESGGMSSASSTSVPPSLVPTPVAAVASMPSAPLPTQIPNPNQLFNGNVNVSGIMPVMQQPHAAAMPPQVISQQQQPPQNVQMKTTVTAVENAFFNQMKYSQGPMNAIQPNRYVEDFASANISFLQDSLVEQNSTGSQQQQPSVTQPIQQHQQPNAMVNQPKQVHSPIQVHQQIQQQVISTQTFTNQNYHSQQQQSQQTPLQQTHHFPPGLKLQNASSSNIPANITPNSNSVQYQQQMPAQNIQNLQEQHHQSQPQQQQQQKQPLVEQQQQNSNHTIINDGLCDKNETNDRKTHGIDKEKSSNRNNEWNQNNQPPQIDTWNNDDTSTGGGNLQNNNSGNNNNSYSRFNRNSNRGSGGGGSKYNNNYRNSNQSRNNYNNNNENLNGGNESNRDRDTGGSTTFFRNNERYNRDGGGRYNNNSSSDRNNMGDRGNYKPREGNYRAGSGRFPSSMATNTFANKK